MNDFFRAAPRVPRSVAGRAATVTETDIVVCSALNGARYRVVEIRDEKSRQFKHMHAEGVKKDGKDLRCPTGAFVVCDGVTVVDGGGSNGNEETQVSVNWISMPSKAVTDEGEPKWRLSDPVWCGLRVREGGNGEFFQVTVFDFERAAQVPSTGGSSKLDDAFAWCFQDDTFTPNPENRLCLVAAISPDGDIESKVIYGSDEAKKDEEINSAMQQLPDMIDQGSKIAIVPGAQIFAGLFAPHGASPDYFLKERAQDRGRAPAYAKARILLSPMTGANGDGDPIVTYIGAMRAPSDTEDHLVWQNALCAAWLKETDALKE